ncbi:hypothetical protein LX81_04234 [Palleronia aestuarii]|uniref:Uncharacterized protein n=1 Tax=Palleronia aestuarii TaxID=568105 RepID=A0A2W7MS27_9RHOB|nr:hypothetical protein LX81_04234 [Palleronia aestuarii]
MRPAGLRAASSVRTASRLVLHLKTTKTGNADLQGNLYSNRDRLLAHGILYPRLVEEKAHHFLTGLFLSAEKLNPALLDRYGPEASARRHSELS